MSTEIELKLRLLPSQAKRLLTHPALADHTPQKYRLLNTYFDTPDRDLCKRGIALRLRRKGWSIWLMTVKGGDPATGGLAQRSEWEAPTQPGVFDFSIVGDAGLREFLESQQARLQPVFSTDFTRSAWVLNHGGAVLELALDRGKIAAKTVCGSSDSVNEPLCEVELELLEGDSPDALFDLAIVLAADLQLHPEVLSKAERGYALAEGSFAQPVKAVPSAVNRAMSPVEAFRSIALSCLMQLQRNEAGAIAGKVPEYIHQSRVAIRRLRSSLGLFSPVLIPAFVVVYSPLWKELAGCLGSVRDWDVFLTETLSPLEDAFPEDPDLAALRVRSEAAKASAQASAAKALTQTDYSRLMLAFSAALFRVEPPTIAAEHGQVADDLLKFANRRLNKRAAAVKRLATDCVTAAPEFRHNLRIAFKKLRYALEFFAPVLPRKPLSRYQASLSRIQDLLGKLNDQITASRLIEEMHPNKAVDLLTRGWLAGRTQLLLVELDSELKRFLNIREPWR